MRICHLADTHLGAGEGHTRRGATGLTERQEDIVNSFTEAIDRIIELKPDLCIHAGDIFDSVRPINRVIAIAAEQLHRLAEIAGIPTVIISGNHDAPKQPHIGAALDIFRQIENLYISAGKELELFTIGNARVFALPHCLTTEIQKQQLERCLPDPNFKYNLIIAHGVAAGMPEFSMAELGEQELPTDILDRFDYAALGHFHNFCQVSKKGFYSGSSERLSQSERESPKGFVEITLEPFTVKLHEVKTRPMIDIATIDASGKRGDELLAEIKKRLDAVKSENKIVRVRVDHISPETLKTIPPESLAELKRNNFDLRIKFERESGPEEQKQFGRSGIGSLTDSLELFLDTQDLAGFDRARLLSEALAYLSSVE